MKVAIYLRVSTEAQSFDSQTHEIDTMLNNRGWKISKRYEEKVSGAKADRAELKALLNDARLGLFDTLVIYKLDRLGRSLKQVIATLDELTHFGVSIISLKENLDLTTPTGRLMIHLITSFAEFERDLIRSRVIDGLKAARAKGKVLGRPRITNVDEVKRLRKQGRSLRSIAKELSVTLGSVQNALKG